MNRRGIIERIAIALAVGCFLFAGSEHSVGESQEPDPWHDAHLFTKPLDQAVRYGQTIDPLNPPPLSVWELIGDSEELTATADYINLGKKRVTLHGRKIKDATGDEERFYPYVRLEVSNQTDRGWEIIGASPPEMAGVPVTVKMVPVKIGVANPTAKSNPSCMIDLNPFKKFVGKFRYGRIVLEGGGVSQVLGLNDLLPPEDALRIGKIEETSSPDQVTSEKASTTAKEAADWLHGVADTAKESNPSSAKMRDDAVPATFRSPPPL